MGGVMIITSVLYALHEDYMHKQIYHATRSLPTEFKVQMQKRD